MKYIKNTKFIGIIIIIIALVLLFFFSFNRLNIDRYQRDQSCPIPPGQHEGTMLPVQSQTYVAKHFDLTGNIKGLSAKQLNEHKTLYERYVAKRNEIAQKLHTVDRANQNRTYSPYRELKIEETYALNGSLLHELYFENMNKKPSNVGPQMNALIEQSFGSFDAFKQDLMAAAQCARGWVLTAYSIDDQRVHNFVLEEHNQKVPVLTIPLLVLDVYEHAYMIDFGIKITSYLDIFWENIDWNVVEQRINKWVNKLRA
jgi:Fe-Mn family superoxide dismutase